MLASPKGTWRAETASIPPAADGFAELRRRLGTAEHPAVAFVTAGGSFDPTHPLLEHGRDRPDDRARGADDSAQAFPQRREVVAVNDGDRVDPAGALAALRARGYELVLCEGGPTLFASFVAAGLVDELFLTVSPLIAGRSGATRLSLADGAELLPGVRVAGDLVSVRRHENHLFLRYGLTSPRA